MNKTLFVFLASLLLSVSSFAQDVIVKKDGNTIVAKVLKITSTEVEYKNYSNLTGPTYTVSVKDLLSINYENGTSDKFNTTEAKQETPTTVNNNSTNQQSIVGNYNKYDIDAKVARGLRKGEIMRKWGGALIGVGAGVVGVTIGVLAGLKVTSTGAAIGLGFAAGAPLYGPGLVLAIIGSRIGDRALALEKQYQTYDNPKFDVKSNVDYIMHERENNRFSLSYAVKF